MTAAGSGPAPGNPPDNAFIELALGLADAAGAVTMTYFRSPMAITVGACAI